MSLTMTGQSIPCVSVIIPVYNDPQRLKICLQALEAQTYPRQAYEVIVVDNGSDATILPIVAEFRQVQAGYEPHPGSYAARNTGLALARGEIVAFTDADCVPAPDWIEKGVQHLMHFPQEGIVGGYVEIAFQHPAQPTAAELYEKIMYFNQQIFIEQQHFSLTANLFTFKRLFGQVGYFDAALKSSGDKAWGQRAAACGYPIVYADDVRVSHPARASYTELRRKVIRLAGGFEDLQRKRNPSKRPFNRERLMEFVPPVKTVLGCTATLHTKIQVLIIWFAMKSIELWTRLKHRVGWAHSER